MWSFWYLHVLITVQVVSSLIQSACKLLLVALNALQELMLLDHFEIIRTIMQDIVCQMNLG